MHDDAVAVDPSERRLSSVPLRPGRSGGPGLLSFVAGLVAVGAIAAAAWVYADTQRDLRRLSTEMAQIRVSLELFNQQLATPGTAAAPAGDALLDLGNRLAILEESWRNQSAAAPAPGTLPPLPGSAAAPAAAAASGDDCMPPGTRFLVTGGDNYPICGSGAEVNISAVEAGYVALADGTTIPNGGNALLRGTTCTVAVVSSGADGMTGYAELRVSC